MAWTEQDYQEIVARLMAGSIGVNEVPNAEDLDNISSLPAYQPANETGAPTVVKASLELLAAPALEAADKANAAATKAEENATAAQTAADTANEKAELAAQAASDANAAKEGAETATQSANNAASNAEEKAAAANTAAQDAEKVANNPTYIGTDHYVYVYNKETDSFDKTGIYCKGEPGSSFRVAGEYATLEALKSAVPDGSAVDGFMAVGTEAPYDYYAWVNGDWVNQGKIAGGGSGNVVIVPIMGLTTQSTSDEIFNAFGGKQNLIDIIKKVKDEDCVVIAKTDDDPNAVVQQTFSVVNATYVNDNNLILGLISWSVNVTSQMIIQVIDGVASYNEISTPLMTEAPSNGNVYGRKNKDWVKVSDKKYVDDSISSARSVGYMMQLTEIDATGLDENTWYPVTIAAGERMNIRVEVLVSLDSGTKPSWSQHEKGFSTRKIWEFVPNAWGVNRDSNITIYLSDFVHADIDPVRGLGNLSHFDTCYVFVRGGGKYHFYASHEAKVILHTDTYAPGDQSVSPTTETPAGIVANIATKKYVDDQMYLLTISNAGHQELISNQETADETVATKINTVFGSADNFKNVVSQLIANKRLVIKITETERFQPGVIHSYMNTDNGAYELSFDYNYSDLASDKLTLLSKRIFIALNDTHGNYFIVRDIVVSDNLTTITKKTAAEYEAIGSKDANTAYCVTD